MLNEEFLRLEPVIIGWRDDGVSFFLRFRSAFQTPWVQVHVQGTGLNQGGSTYDPAHFVTSTQVDCRADRMQDVSITIAGAMWIFLVPVQYDGAGVKILYDGQSGRPNKMAFIEIGSIRTGAMGPPGPEGMEGPEGPMGAPGPAGVAGAAGTSGAAGLPGAMGPPGMDGIDGEPSFEMGPPGATGPAGAAGSPGAAGAPGALGSPGTDGIDGESSYEMGPPGPVGSTGASGAPGATGGVGPMGAPGIDGIDGEPSFEMGPPGPPGAPGWFTGVATLDFGAFPGSSHATVAITGLPNLNATSRVLAWVEPSVTADHSEDEHMLETILVSARDRIAGTGFTIHGWNRSDLFDISGMEPKGTLIYGQFTVGYAWKN